MFFSRLLSSQPHSALQSPFYRSTPIDPLQEFHPQINNNNNNNILTIRSQSADPTISGLFSTYPSNNYQQSSNSYSLDSHLNTSHYHQTALPSHRSISSIDHQQDIQGTISKDSIDKQQNDQTSSTNESLTRYVKMLLERSPAQEKTNSKTQYQEHPLAKTNQSLHDLQLSIEQFNLAERDSKIIVDDLQNITPRQRKPSNTSAGGGVKKRLDYDIHNHKQSNTNELFERLSQPKTKIKKDKPKQPQQQQPSNGVWK